MVTGAAVDSRMGVEEGGVMWTGDVLAVLSDM